MKPCSNRRPAQRTLVVALLLWTAANMMDGQAVEPGPGLKPAARDAISDEKLRELMTGAGKMDAQMARKSKPLDTKRPNIGNSLYSKSIIIFDGEKHTVVPIGSVLHLPEPLRDHVITEPKGDFTYWPNFLKRNGAWLASKEVPLKMAKGDVESARAILGGLTMDAHMLVAVYKGGPISILEPVTPAPATQPTRP